MMTFLISFGIAFLIAIAWELFDISRENWNLKQQVKDAEDADRKEG